MDTNTDHFTPLALCMRGGVTSWLSFLEPFPCVHTKQLLIRSSIKRHECHSH